MSLILKAAEYAARQHHGQFRKYTNRPYIEHPMRVAGRASMENGVSEAVVAAAWLHDVVEDCGVSPEGLHIDKFPITTVDLVKELTNPSKGFPHLERRERKKMDREHLGRTSYWAKIIKLLDRIDNVRDMRGADPDFQRIYCKETRQLIDVLAKTPDAPIHALIAELDNELFYYNAL